MMNGNRHDEKNIRFALFANRPLEMKITTVEVLQLCFQSINAKPIWSVLGKTIVVLARSDMPNTLFSLISTAYLFMTTVRSKPILNTSQKS